MALKLGMMVDLRMAYIYAHARFNVLDLDARSLWLGRGKHSALNISTTEQAISVLLTTVPHVPDFEHSYMT